MSTPMTASDWAMKHPRRKYQCGQCGKVGIEDVCVTHNDESAYVACSKCGQIVIVFDEREQ